MSNLLLNRVARSNYFILGLLLLYSLSLGVYNSYLFAFYLFLSFGGFLIFILFYRPNWVLRPIVKLIDRLSWKHVFIIALLLRLGWVLFGNVTQTSDFQLFDRMAIEILDGWYIINPIKPTGPSIFFAGHYYLLGYNTIYPQISIAILSTLQVLLVYSILIQTTKNKRIALLGSVLLASWPEHIFYTNLLGSDVLFSTAILFAVWLLVIVCQSTMAHSGILTVIAGISFGISHWMRPTAPLFIFVAIIFLLVGVKKLWFQRIKSAILLGLGFIILILPIVYLNYLTIGVASPSPSQKGGWALMVGTNIITHGSYNKEDWMLLTDETKKHKPREGEHPSVFRDRLARRIGLKRIIEQPLHLLFIALRYKIPTLWANAAGLSWSISTSRIKNIARPIYILAEIWHKFFLGICGVVLFLRAIRGKCQWDARQIFFYAFIFTTFMHFFGEVQSRYHHMFLPFFCMGISEILLFHRENI